MGGDARGKSESVALGQGVGDGQEQATWLEGALPAKSLNKGAGTWGASPFTSGSFTTPFHPSIPLPTGGTVAYYLNEWSALSELRQQ